jgi:hypothetical protein
MSGRVKRRRLVYHLDLVVTQHPCARRQRDEVSVFEIFFVGFMRRDGPEQKIS